MSRRIIKKCEDELPANSIDSAILYRTLKKLEDFKKDIKIRLDNICMYHFSGDDMNEFTSFGSTFILIHISFGLFYFYVVGN